MRRVLVIGGTGFIGLHVIDALLEGGAEVTVTRRKQSITLLARRRPVQWAEASLEDRSALAAAMRGHDAVVFTAGHYPRYSLDAETAVRTGVAGVENVLAAAAEAGVSRVVYTSTSATLDGPASLPVLDGACRAPTPPTGSAYRLAKWHMERAVDAGLARGLDVVTILPGGCLGPGDLRLGTAGLLVGVAAGALPWMIDGLVNLVDVRDVAQAHVRALRDAPRGARYALGGHTHPLREVMAMVIERVGGRLPPLVLDASSARARADEEERLAAPKRERVPFPREFVDIVAHGRAVSSVNATEALGLELTPLATALDDALAWLVQHRFIARPEPLRKELR